MADKKAVFVVRADGSVMASQNNSGWWTGDPLNAGLAAWRLNRGAGKSAKNRHPQLDNSSPGSAASDFCRTDRCVFQAVRTEVWKCV